MPARALAILALMTNALVWGLSWWPLRWLSEAGLHPLWATGLIFALVLAMVTLHKPRVWQALLASRALWGLALASGFTNVAFNWAVTLGDVVRVVLLFYLMPAWAMLLARYLLKERISRHGLLRLCLAVMGVLLVLKAPKSPWPLPSSLADWLALGGGFTFALTNILILRLSQSSDTERLFAMFAGGALAALGVATVGVWAQLVPSLPGVSWALAFAVAGMGGMFFVGNLAMQYGASRLASSTTSLVMLTEIVFATLSAVWLGAAVLEVRVVLGALLICSAAVWAALA